MQRKMNKNWLIWEIDPDEVSPKYTITLYNNRIEQNAIATKYKKDEMYKYNEFRASAKGWERAEDNLPCYAKLTYKGIVTGRVDKDKPYEHGYCVGKAEGKVEETELYRYTKMPGWDEATVTKVKGNKISQDDLEEILNAKTSGWLSEFENVTVIDKTDYKKLEFL